MLTILKPGLLTTVQDLGRYGYQKYGIVVSGAMDRLAHRLANMLVLNEETAPTIEITLSGPSIQFERNAVIALCGGDLSPHINGNPVKLWTPLSIDEGDILDFGAAKSGCRTYLAIHGGFCIEAIFGSRSTYTCGQLGGYKGRPLRTGDQLRFHVTDSALHQKIKHQKQNWHISPQFFSSSPAIRIIKGKQFDLFIEESQADFFTKAFTLSNESDRMGYRLTGPSLRLKEKKELISEGVNYGSIQVPPSGAPIILLADRQTVGGYPKIAQIASIDFSVIAQKKPGDSIQFTNIQLEEAQHLLLQQEQNLCQLKQAIQLKLQS